MAECAAVRSLYSDAASIEKGRVSLFIVIPGGSTDPLWDAHLRLAVEDVTRGPGMDAFVRLVLPDPGAPGGARLVRPLGVDREYLTKEDGDIAGILQATIHSLAPAETEGAPLLKAGLWTLEGVADGELDDWAMAVAIFFLAEHDDCSAEGAVADCSDSQSLSTVEDLVAQFTSAIEVYRESSVRRELQADFPWVFLASISAGTAGCSIGEQHFPAATRLEAFIEQMTAVPHALSAQISICEDDWSPRFRATEDQYDSAYPENRTMYVFTLSPVSSELVWVFLNGVPVNRRDLTYKRLTEDLAGFSAEDVWNWFEADAWQQLSLPAMPDTWRWGDTLSVSFCPFFHEAPPPNDLL